MKTATVPCDGCRACCQGDAIFLHPEAGDDSSLYETEPMFNPLSRKMGKILKRAENGDCGYLGETGCTIHDKRPAICREFDCRRMYAMTTRDQRRQFVKSGMASREVFEAGRQRLRTLK